METDKVKWTSLLKEALEKPGVISEAYSFFHDYSFGNQMLALQQCRERGLKPGPIATFPKWLERKRWVRRGEKALTLCMPVMAKVKEKDGTVREEFKQLFIFRPRWFVLSQTDGADWQESIETPDWDYKRALDVLNIKMKPFDLMDGNTQGYAEGREVAVSPIAEHGTKTLLHEVSHIVLGHTTEGQMSDSENTPRNIREVEAEGSTFILLSLLDLPGAEFSRGYIQHWAAGEPITEKMARRIFGAADEIFKAGAVNPEEGGKAA